MNSLRRSPFGEWNIVYYDPKKTDTQKILARLRAKGCPRAELIPATKAEHNEVVATVENPFVTPGDCFQLTFRSAAKEARTLELQTPKPWKAAPKKVTLKAGSNQTVLLRVPTNAAEGKHMLQLTSSGKKLSLPVHVVQQIR